MGESHEYRFCVLENVAFNILSFYLEFRYHASFCIIWCGVVLHQSLCQHFGIKLLEDIFVFNVLEHNHLHKQTDKTTIRGDKESAHKVILRQESTDYKWLKYSLRSKRFRLVSERRKTEERDFRFWPREQWNESQKNEREGRGRGKKETLADKSIPGFWKPPLASKRSAWLAQLVEQYKVWELNNNTMLFVFPYFLGEALSAPKHWTEACLLVEDKTDRWSEDDL